MLLIRSGFTGFSLSLRACISQAGCVPLFQYDRQGRRPLPEPGRTQTATHIGASALGVIISGIPEATGHPTRRCHCASRQAGEPACQEKSVLCRGEQNRPNVHSRQAILNWTGLCQGCLQLEVGRPRGRGDISRRALAEAVNHCGTWPDLPLTAKCAHGRQGMSGIRAVLKIASPCALTFSSAPYCHACVRLTAINAGALDPRCSMGYSH
jgi:hypothetical protein